MPDSFSSGVVCLVVSWTFRKSANTKTQLDEEISKPGLVVCADLGGNFAGQVGEKPDGAGREEWK